MPTIQLYIVRRHRLLSGLLGAHPAIRCDGLVDQYAQSRYRIYVLVRRMGSVILGAICYAIRQATGIYPVASRNLGKSSSSYLERRDADYTSGYHHVGVRSLENAKASSQLLIAQNRPYANTNGQWIARNILNGFFTAPIEALPEITVTDVVGILPLVPVIERGS